jgi:hypothetical protein
MCRPVSADSVVTSASEMPHGTIRSNQDRSQSQFSAIPCMVTPRATRAPIAPTLRSGSPSTQAPLRPGTRTALTPNSAQVRIIDSSSART